jgi:hypothetical protein
LHIDNQPFVTWTEQTRLSSLTAAFFVSLNALRIATLNFNHPFLPLLLTRVKPRCLDILRIWATNPVPGVTDQLSASEIESLRGEIDSFDSSCLSTDSLLSSIQDIQFTSTRLSPVPLEQHWLNFEDELDWMNFFKAAYGPDPHDSSHGLPASEGVPGFFLARFRELVVIFFNSLSDVSDFSPLNDPLRNVIHVPAIRSIPAREFLVTDNEQRTAFAPDWKIRADAAGAERQISETNAWLAELRRIDTNYEVFCEPLEITFPNKPPSETIRHLRFIGIRDKTTGTVVSLSETGTGFSQLLPVLLASFHGGEAPTCIQQPELHLHPALQAELGDLFVKQALQFDAESDTVYVNQFLIETHSEHLLLRIMRRIRETTKGSLPPHLPPVTPNDVSVLYVEPAAAGSIVRTMPLSEDGHLLYDWPGGFFEEGLREVLM